jgi:hypothetical protein
LGGYFFDLKANETYNSFILGTRQVKTLSKVEGKVPKHYKKEIHMVDQLTDPVVKKAMFVELLKLIASTQEKVLVETIAEWLLLNNKDLASLPDFIKLVSNEGYEADLKKVLDALSKENSKWLNDLSAEDAKEIMVTLANLLDDCDERPNNQTVDAIVHVLAMSPLAAIDALDDGLDERNDLVKYVKEMIKVMTDC